MTYFQKAAENAVRAAEATETWRSVPKHGTVAQRIRYVADGPSPWIPGADADFIKEIADTLEDQERQIARLEAALRGAGVAAELVEHIKVGD